jgi:rsbT co-antagonist protein RsbR
MAVRGSAKAIRRTMSKPQSRTLETFLKSKETGIIDDWIVELGRSLAANARVSIEDLQRQAREMHKLLGEAVRGDTLDINAAGSAGLRSFLETLSRTRAVQGFTSEQTATFIFSLKKPIFKQLRAEFSSDPTRLADETWAATELIDRLGIFTVMAYQKTREEIIRRQEAEMLELSTPVVKLWHGVIALPLIGTLDSSRTQIVMESLLQRIIEGNAEIAIIDITGVPTVDTLVAQHLLKTVTAIRLMGADCIISGVRPQIAQNGGPSWYRSARYYNKIDSCRRTGTGSQTIGAHRIQDKERSGGRMTEHIPILRVGDFLIDHHPGRLARPAGPHAAG